MKGNTLLVILFLVTFVHTTEESVPNKVKFIKPRLDVIEDVGDGVCCPGFTNPPNCDVEDPCYGIFCANGGVCGPTGKCDCPMGVRGVHCNELDCSLNGFYDPIKDTCRCQLGWAGPNCTTCDTLPKDGKIFLCVPTKKYSSSGYVLQRINETLGLHVVSKGTSLIGTEIDERFDKKNRLRYPAIRPGTKGHDGFVRNCKCEKTEITRDISYESSSLMPRFKGSTTEEVRDLFTKKERYAMMQSKMYTEDKKEEWRIRNRQLGMLSPRDTDSGEFDNLAQECLAALSLTETELTAISDYYGVAISHLELCAQPCEECDDTSGGMVGPFGFWVLVAWAMFMTIVVIILALIKIYYLYDIPELYPKVSKRSKKRNKTRR